MFFCLVDVLSSTYLEIFLLFVTKKEKNLSEDKKQDGHRRNECLAAINILRLRLNSIWE
jgi:hypothetical protein